MYTKKPPKIVDYDTWIQYIKTIKPRTDCLLSLDAVEYLRPVICGYMTFCIGQYGRDYIEAKTHTVTDLDDSKKRLIESQQKIYMYYPIWLPSLEKLPNFKMDSEKITLLDTETFNRIMSQSYYEREEQGIWIIKHGSQHGIVGIRL